MHSFIKSLLAVASLGAAFALPTANAQLLLTGSTHGEFVDPGLLHTSVLNGPVESLFESGVAFRPQAPYFDTRTAIKFTGASFADIGNGDLLDLGAIQITNGVTRLKTTAGSAAMDLYLNLPTNGVLDFKLTTLLFSIDNTSNDGVQNVPDLFFIGNTLVNPFYVDGHKVTLDLHLTNPQFGTGAGASISEGSIALNGIYAYVHFTPVPEPSTYALWGTALLLGVAYFKRTRAARAAV